MRFRRRGLNANVSAKLTQMGMDFDPELPNGSWEIVAHAAAADGFVRVDMEAVS